VFKKPCLERVWGDRLRTTGLEGGERSVPKGIYSLGT